MVTHHAHRCALGVPHRKPAREELGHLGVWLHEVRDGTLSIRELHRLMVLEPATMRVFDPKTGKSFLQKRRHRLDQPGHARELTFSCYHRFQFLSRDRTRKWFVEAMETARSRWSFDLWAYVLMPEHVHLLIYPRQPNLKAGKIAGHIKEAVARKAIAYLEEHAPSWLPRITVREGKRVRRRFRQPGGGFDRNAVELPTVYHMIEYIHANPVRRGLAARAGDWPWSIARWYAGVRPVPIEMDRTLPSLHPDRQ